MKESKMPVIIVHSAERFRAEISHRPNPLPPHSEIVITQHHSRRWFDGRALQLLTAFFYRGAPIALLPSRPSVSYPKFTSPNTTVRIQNFIVDTGSAFLIAGGLSNVQFPQSNTKFIFDSDRGSLGAFLGRVSECRYQLDLFFEIRILRAYANVSEINQLMDHLERALLAHDHLPTLSLSLDVHTQAFAEEILARLRRLPPRKLTYLGAICTNRSAVDTSIAQLIQSAKCFPVAATPLVAAEIAARPIVQMQELMGRDQLKANFEFGRREIEFAQLSANKEYLYNFENQYSQYLRISNCINYVEIRVLEDIERLFEKCSITRLRAGTAINVRYLPDPWYPRILNLTPAHYTRLAELCTTQFCAGDVTLYIENRPLNAEIITVFSNLLTSGRCTNGFRLNVENCDLGTKEAVIFANTLRRGRCPQSFELHIAQNNIGLEGVRALMDAVCSGSCPQGFGLGLTLSKKPQIDTLEEANQFMDLFAQALASGRCPEDLLIATGVDGSWQKPEVVEWMLQRFKMIPHQHLLRIRQFLLMGRYLVYPHNLYTIAAKHIRNMKDLCWYYHTISTHIQDAKKYYGISVPPQTTQPLLTAHAKQMQNFRIEEHESFERLMQTQQMAYAAIPLQVAQKEMRTIYQSEEMIARKGLEWFATREREQMKHLAHHAELLHSEVVTNERYQESLADGEPCPVCKNPYNNIDVRRLVLVPCHHLICQSCWILVQGYAGSGMKCPTCRQDVMRFKLT